MLDKKMFYKKFLLYLLGLIVLSIGSNLFINANLGVAPSCTLALTLTYLFPFGSYALFNFITNILLLLMEAFFSKSFSKTQVLQIVLVIFYSLFIQLVAPFISFMIPSSFLFKTLTVLLACFIMAIGSCLTITSELTVLPMEGLVGVISVIKHQEFGIIRMKLEISMTIIVGIFSFITMRNFSSIGIGTVLAAYLTGRITLWFRIHFQDKIQKLL